MAHQRKQGVRRFRLAPFLFLARRGRIFEHCGEPVDGLPIFPGDQVPVGIYGDLNGVVSSLLLDIGEGFPVPDEPRGVRVALMPRAA